MINSSPSYQGGSNRRQNILFIAATVILAVLIIANMVLIYLFSAEDAQASGDRSEGVTDAVADVVYPDLSIRPPAEQESIFATLHQFIRKLAHFAEFASLGFWSAALLLHLAGRLTKLRPWMQWLIPAVFGLLYAISDEVHQYFTERGPAVADVLIDFAGVLIGLGLLRLGARLVRCIHAAHRRRQAQDTGGKA